MKAATHFIFLPVVSTVFQSTPPVKAATRNNLVSRPEQGISIHAAREGGDKQTRNARRPDRISIHAAREGGDVLAFP